MADELFDELAAEIDRLWRDDRPRAAGVVRLAQSVLTAAWDAASPAELFASEPSAPNPLRTAVRAARVVAWAAVHLLPARADAEELVVAALLSDAGRLKPERVPSKENDLAHPGMSATLVAGCRDAPVCLGRLVARHHERSDGTGFPQRLTDARLTTGDRLVAAAVRFAELFAGDAADAARRLHEEARRGAFDADLTGNLVRTVAGSLPTDGGFGKPAPQPWPLTERGRLRLRFDAAEGLPSQPGPHFAAVPKAARSAAVGRG